MIYTYIVYVDYFNSRGDEISHFETTGNIVSEKKLSFQMVKDMATETALDYFSRMVDRPYEGTRFALLNAQKIDEIFA